MDCEKKIMELSARTDLENLQSIIYQTRYQEAIRQQLEGILTALQSDSYSTVSDYLSRCYQDGYIGVMYDLHGQDIPLIMPIDQKAVVRAIQTDSKISKGLYNRLGEDVGKLKTSIRAEVSRGIAAGFTWNEVAKKLAKSFKTTEFSKAYNNAMRIVRTEGHRIQIQSAMDAQQVAKDHGADIVKQWDATLDDRTRETHRMLDGQIRELDEPFEVGGMQADAPGMFGIAAQDCNCRCALLQRARWELDEDELNTLKERAEFFGLDKTKDFEDFKEKYFKAAEQYEDRKEKTIKNNVDAADILTQEETIEKAKKYSSQPFELLIISPIHLGNGVGDDGFDSEFDLASEQVSRQLAQEYRKVATHYHVGFLDASKIALPSEIDREHLDESGHAALADAVYKTITESGLLEKGMGSSFCHIA